MGDYSTAGAWHRSIKTAGRYVKSSMVSVKERIDGL
jgi:hypothetical protein